MRYPNLRYGNPNEMAYYAQGVPLKELAKRLRRSERCVRDWLTGATRLPWWVPEIMRLQHQELAERMRQMGMGKLKPKLGIVTADVIQLAQVKKEPAPVDLEQEARQLRAM